MSWFSKITGQDAAKIRREQKSIQQYGEGNDPSDQLAKALNSAESGGGWQQAFQQTAGAYMNEAMPQLRTQLQLSQEDAVRRGISTGDLGTSNEGDILSAFQQNTSNTLGGLATSEYENNQNRYLNLLTGTLDRNQSNSNSNANMWAGIGGAALSAAGSALGGPLGGQLGSWLGSVL